MKNNGGGWGEKVVTGINGEVEKEKDQCKLERIKKIGNTYGTCTLVH